MIEQAPPRAVLFDLDGTVLDTEKLAHRCFHQACADVGWQVDDGLYLQCVGTTYQATAQILREDLGHHFPLEEMRQRWGVHYRRYIEKQPVAIKPGIEDLLRYLRCQSIPMAVVTSSRRPEVETKLGMCGLLDFFNLLVCADEALAGKPDPAPYLLASLKLQVSPDKCWALEDSDNGTRSAHAAGTRVFQIPDMVPPGTSMLDLGHRIVDSAHVVLHELVAKP